MINVAWRPIPSCPGHEASSDGQIRAFSLRWRRTYVKKLGLDGAGYLVFWRLVDGKQRGKLVHSAVTEAFYGPRPEGAVVRHLNGDPLDNRLENLAWGTQSENMHDRVRHGNSPQAGRTHCPQNHPYDEANTYRYAGMTRACRICNREAVRRYKQKRAAVTA